MGKSFYHEGHEGHEGLENYFSELRALRVLRGEMDFSYGARLLTDTGPENLRKLRKL